MRKNPELEPLRQSVVVYNLVLETSATALVPNCNNIADPLDQLVTKNILQTGEDTPASPCGVDTTRGATNTGYKPSRYWRTDGGRGLRISLDSYRPSQAG